ncbi:hypothetical protein Tco_0848148, partial [Tanacetum coccineum]
DIAEVDNASLRARIKTIEAIKKITHNRERQVRIKMEQQLAAVQESLCQDREDFRKLKELMTSQKNLKIQEVSQHSESRTPDVRGDLKRWLRSRRSRSMSRSPEPTPSIFFRIRRDRSESPRNRLGDKGRKEGGVFKRIGVHEEVCPHTQRAATKVPVQEERNRSPKSVTMKRRLHGEQNHSQRVRISEEDTGSQDRKNKSRSLKRTTCLSHGRGDFRNQQRSERTHDKFRLLTKSPREILALDKGKFKTPPPMTRMPSNVKKYDGNEDPVDHLKIFQAAAKVERWAMPTWCHMFNSTLTGSTRVLFDDLPPKSVESYDDLKKAFLANFLQQKKCIKDHVEIHHIK